MKRVTKLLALMFVCSLALAGCKKKKAGEGSGTAAAGTAAAGTAAAGTAAAGTAAAGTAAAGTADGTAAAGTADGTGGGAAVPEALSGVAECASYVKFYNCYLGKMPAAASDPAKKAFAKSLEMWGKMPKASVAAACKAAMDGIKKSAAASPQMKKWVGDCAK